MVHMTGGSTLPPTWTCSSASGPRELASNATALQLELQPVGFEGQTQRRALLDILAGALHIAHLDLDVRQLQPGPGEPGLLGLTLLRALKARLDGLLPVPVADQDSVDQI